MPIVSTNVRCFRSGTEQILTVISDQKHADRVDHARVVQLDTGSVSASHERVN